MSTSGMATPMLSGPVAGLSGLQTPQGAVLAGLNGLVSQPPPPAVHPLQPPCPPPMHLLVAAPSSEGGPSAPCSDSTQAPTQATAEQGSDAASSTVADAAGDGSKASGSIQHQPPPLASRYAAKRQTQQPQRGDRRSNSRGRGEPDNS